MPNLCDNDVIFYSTNQDYCEEFGKMMCQEFEMSMIDELSFILGFQVKQIRDETFICQIKYVHVLK